MNPYETKEYQEFVESMMQFCKCEPLSERPCDGVLAGGLCDRMNYLRDESDPDEDY